MDLKIYCKPAWIIIFIFLFSIPGIAVSQNIKKVDSLKRALAQTTDAQKKATCYIDLSFWVSKSDMHARKNYLDSALILGIDKMDIATQMMLNARYADYYDDASQQPDSTIKYATNTITLANKLKNKLVAATAYNFKGNALLAKRDFKNAEAAYIEAMHTYTGLNNELAIGNLYVNLGYLFQQQRLTKEAEVQYNEAGTIFKKLGNNERLAQLFNNYGILYGENNQFLKSEQYFDASLHIREKLTDTLALANSYLNVGGINVLLKNYAKGEANLLKAKNQFQKLNNTQGITSCLTNLGELYEQKKNYPKAIASFKESIRLARSNHNNEDLENALLGISNIYTKMGDYKTAYAYKDNLSNLKDTLYQKNLTGQIAEMQIKFETQKKEQQINLLSKENTIQKLSISNRNTTIAIIISLFLLALVMGLLFYNRYKSKQEALLQAEVIHQQTLASKGIIEAEEQERKRIAAELHDGVGQLFTTVKMNMEILMERFLVKQPDADQLAEKTMAMVDESCNEVRSIAHQMMPNALIKSGLLSALRDFINKIPTEKLKISLDTKGIDKPLESTTETVLYRIIQESVNNVIKHADATSLDILLLCDEKEITVSIEDNGKGFDTTDKNKFNGIGLKNIISRVGYLKGSVDISSSPGKGTLVAIFIPLT
jgi:signal transduction histidine kinase